MAYDMEFWNDYTCELPSHPYKCSPACSPRETNEWGITTFLNLGIAPAKLVLALPWYGISYEKVLGVPFNRGALPLSDVETIAAAAPSKPSLDSYSHTKVLVCGGKCGSTQGTEIWCLAPPQPPPPPDCWRQVRRRRDAGLEVPGDRQARAGGRRHVGGKHVGLHAAEQQLGVARAAAGGC